MAAMFSSGDDLERYIVMAAAGGGWEFEGGHFGLDGELYLVVRWKSEERSAGTRVKRRAKLQRVFTPYVQIAWLNHATWSINHGETQEDGLNVLLYGKDGCIVAEAEFAVAAGAELFCQFRRDFDQPQLYLDY